MKKGLSSSASEGTTLTRLALTYDSRIKRPFSPFIVALACAVFLGAATEPATRKARPTLAVLPFIAATNDAAEKALAERMRFAVSQKLSTDINGRESGGAYDRLDNVQVENVISAAGVSWTKLPDEGDVQQVLAALKTQWAITGFVKGRTLSLTLYEGAAVVKQASIEIPPERESPKLAVEKILTELTGTPFQHIRELEVDHSNPAAEARFAANKNLVPDASFEEAAKEADKTAKNWQAIFLTGLYPPPRISLEEAKTLPVDRVAVVPVAAAGGAPGAPAGECLMLRMSDSIATINGLACESTWIPVEQGKKYRFTVKYHSNGPSVRLFLKGFGQKADAFGNPDDLEAIRREYYRAQVLQRDKNAGWNLIEMDFTPGAVKPTDPKIEWVRVDLYIYLQAGDVFFDDVVVKKLDP